MTNSKKLAGWFSCADCGGRSHAKRKHWWRRDYEIRTKHAPECSALRERHR